MTLDACRYDGRATKIICPEQLSSPQSLAAYYMMPNPEQDVSIVPDCDFQPWTTCITLQHSKYQHDSPNQTHPKPNVQYPRTGCAAARAWLEPNLTNQQRVDRVLECMTLADQIGQMLMLRPYTFADWEIGALGIGGAWYPATTGFKTSANKADNWVSKNEQQQRHSDATVFPHQIGVGAICAGKKGDALKGCAAIAQDIGQAVGIALQAAGIHMFWGPTLCLARDMRWGRAYECFGEDPELVSAMGVMIKAKLDSAMGVMIKVLTLTSYLLLKLKLLDPNANPHPHPELITAIGVMNKELVSAMGVMITGNFNTNMKPKSSANPGPNPDFYLCSLSRSWSALSEWCALPLPLLLAGVNSAGVVATPKHYAGDGNVAWGTGQNGRIDSRVDGTLMHEHGQLLTNVLRKGCATRPVLTSWFSDTRATCARSESNAGLGVQISEDLKFCGVSITDFGGIEVATGNDMRTKTRNVVVAGNDLLLCPREGSGFEAAENIRSNICNTDGVSQGCGGNCVPRERVREAAARVLMLKAKLGLLTGPSPLNGSACGYPGNMPQPQRISDEANSYKVASRKLALLAAEKSQVLLKNLGGAVPLTSTKVKTVLLLGSSAESVARLCGGWNIDWQARDGELQKGTTVKKALVSAGFTVTTSTTTATDAANKSGYSSVVSLVVVGEPPYAEFYGDKGAANMDMALSSADKDAITKACTGRPWKCVVVVVSGRPITLDSAFYSNDVDAVVAAWLPGSEGGTAIVNKLFGRAPSGRTPSWKYEGRLPVTWLKNFDSGPGSAALFDYGYGCSTVAASSSNGIKCDASALAKSKLGLRKRVLLG
ncbi:hypothetical protein JKP88DRAFT_244676 [Tribonema minus]|uniref:beta-glucosidase n=1 Tax=Tribonema minus TaxID=303371 RepID=A0A835Z0A2_9STRA|nr:hypothetical protein JKP88DRAFT_244676 [Tribonema minus]